MGRSRACHVGGFFVLAVVAASPGFAQSSGSRSRRHVERSTVTILGRMCAFVCSDAGIDAMNALLDDPKNDAVPFATLPRVRANVTPNTSARGSPTPR
jgi:hypothetical protein